MLDAAERSGIRHVVGLQGQLSPAINYARDLIADGYVGRVLTATMIGVAPNWGAAIDRAYQADRTNGANLLTITGGHQIDALCYCLGEFRELTAFAVSQRDRIPLEGTGELVAKDTPDQLVVNGILGDGCGGRIVSNPWRDDPWHRVPVRDPRRSRGSCPDRHHARLDAASGTDGPRRAGCRQGSCGIADPGPVSLGPGQHAPGLPVQRRPALRAFGRKHPAGHAGKPQLCRGGHPASAAGRDYASFRRRTETGPVDTSRLHDAKPARWGCPRPAMLARLINAPHELHPDTNSAGNKRDVLARREQHAGEAASPRLFANEGC